MGANLTHDGGVRYFAIGVEGRNKAAGNEVVHPLFFNDQSRRFYSGGHNGVVIGDFGVVENLFTFLDGFSNERRREAGIRFHVFQDAFNLRVHVGGQKSGVDTRIGHHLFLVKVLNVFQRFVGCVAEFLVTFDLQGGQIEKLWRGFFPFFLFKRNDFEEVVFNLLDNFGCLFGGAETPVGRGENNIPVVGFDLPERHWYKILDLFVPANNQREGRGLYPANGKNPFAVGIFQGVKPAGIHSQQPVANGAGISGGI